MVLKTKVVQKASIWLGLIYCITLKNIYNYPVTNHLLTILYHYENTEY